MASRAGVAPRRGDRRDARGACGARGRSGFRAGGAELRVARALRRGDRRGDLRDVRRAPRRRRARRGGAPRGGPPRPRPRARCRRPGRARDPHPRRLPPRPGPVVDRRRLGRHRLRGRACPVAARAPPEALPASRPRRDDALVRLRGGCLAPALGRRGPAGMGRGVPRGVRRGLPRERRRAAAAAEPGGVRPAPRPLRAREARLRAPLRGAEPARLGVDPDRGHARACSRRPA